MKDIIREQYLKAIVIVTAFEKQVKRNYELIEMNPAIQNITPDTYIVDVKSMSMRLSRCLRWYAVNYNIDFKHMKMSHLQGVSVRVLLLIRTFGKGTLYELKNYCAVSGIKLTE